MACKGVLLLRADCGRTAHDEQAHEGSHDDANHTYDANGRSWLASANAEGGDFPVQNLSFAVFRCAGCAEAMRGSVVIGDQMLDLAALAATRLLSGVALDAANARAPPALNDFLHTTPIQEMT